MQPERESWTAIIERHRSVVALAAVVGALLGGGGAYLAQPSYESSAKLVVVPVDDPTATGGVTAGYDLATVTLPVVMAILHSRHLGEEVVERLGLVRAWDATPSEALERLSAGLGVGSERKSNLVTISFSDRSPERARSVVAALAELGAKMSSELWAERNRQHRQALERDLAQVDARLATAEEALQEFRQRNHVFDLPEQIKATVDEGAALQRLRIDKTMDVRLARGFGGPESIEVQKGSLERSAAARALDALQKGRGGAPLLPLDRLPRLEVEHARLKRALDEQSTRHDLLALKVSQLVAAEARPGGIAQLIDPPTVPGARSTAPLVRGVLAGAVLAALLAVLMVRRRATRSLLLPPPISIREVRDRSENAG